MNYNKAWNISQSSNYAQALAGGWGEDWLAWYDDDEDGPNGAGESEAAAIEDLNETHGFD